ncbi:ABC transporter ATP-binding protein [Wukongibacter baidiensis]|uniref:ABC transporter ATP-binding protein n=1 Tax=Wukongibacter baidiensis TaxID=1723361 RepID=UPI003D7F99ED
MDTILEVRDLCIQLKSKKDNYNLTEEISFDVKKGEAFGIVGESGCGKSLTAYSIMGLISSPNLKTHKGSITFEDKDLLKMSKSEIQKIRGKDIAMIFQEPMTALDPLFTIGDQLMEALEIHRDINKTEMKRLSIEILKKVGIPRAETIIDEYPHQLSGGMLQRVMIGIAMINNPKILVADEPTTALDVTIQAQILSLMNELRNDYGMALIMITHDLGVIAETCDRVAVFYGGHIVEVADVVSLFHKPMHPYTKGLIKSVKTLGNKNQSLYTIPGTVPTIDQMGRGCRFVDRCESSVSKCKDNKPPLREYENGHLCRCWLHEEG